MCSLSQLNVKYGMTNLFDIPYSVVKGRAYSQCTKEGLLYVINLKCLHTYDM
jgi:hypothetical protein